LYKRIIERSSLFVTQASVRQPFKVLGNFVERELTASMYPSVKVGQCPQPLLSV